MKRLLLMDEQNYEEGLPEIKREAVRAVITLNGKMLFAGDKYGELKLPGGGIENDESDIDALIREVREETGYTVIPDSVRPFGYIEEKRKSVKEEMIWHQFSRIYFCEVAAEQGNCDYSESEQRLGFRLVMCTIDEAIEANIKMFEQKDEQAWNRREYKTLLLLKEYFASDKENNI